jgi:hypothetical protein
MNSICKNNSKQASGNRTKMGMKTPTSFIYFLAGVFASAGVNLFTAIPAGNFDSNKMYAIFVSASSWVLTSFFVASYALHREEFDKVIQRAIPVNASDTERHAIIKAKWRENKHILAFWFIGSFVTTIVSIVSVRLRLI